MKLQRAGHDQLGQSWCRRLGQWGLPGSCFQSLILWAPASHVSTGDPSTLAGGLSGLLWGHCSFPLGSSTCQICLGLLLRLGAFCSVFPYTLAGLKVRFPWDSQVRSLIWGSEPSQHSWYYCSSALWSLPAGMLDMIYWLCPSCCLAVLLLCLWPRVLAQWVFSVLGSDGCSTAGCEFGLSQRGWAHVLSTPPSWSQKEESILSNAVCFKAQMESFPMFTFLAVLSS